MKHAEIDCGQKCFVHKDIRIKVKRVKQQCRCLPMRPESLIEEYDMNNFSQVVYVQDITGQIKNELRIKEMLNV